MALVALNWCSTKEILTCKDYRDVHPFFQSLRIISRTDANPVTGTRATWKLEEGAKLTSAVANTFKKKYNKECKTNWAAIAALVSSRTRSQCLGSWKDVLDPNIDRAYDSIKKTEVNLRKSPETVTYTVFTVSNW